MALDGGHGVWSLQKRVNAVATILFLSDQDCSIAYQLIECGAFDDLFRSDPTMGVQEHGVVSTRLRTLSEPMEWIGPCTFQMGDDSLEAWDFEQPVHTVELQKAFGWGAYRSRSARTGL